MGPFIRHLELPLLAKELNEQSDRQRTYVIRFVYAGLLFGVAFGFFYGSFSSGVNTGEIFGQGLLMFERLIMLQFWGIVLFLLAMACGTLTSEKERDCLGLLLVTALTPWDIILQKLLGRLIPVVTFLFLSFPLMAIAYSYGGVTEYHLWTGILLLFLTCLQIGSLSVMCSAFFRTTSEAFVATYVILLVLCFCCFPVAFLPWVYDLAAAVGPTGTVLLAVPMMLSIAAFLVLARISLVPRAFVSPQIVTLRLLRGLDMFFEEMNQMTGGVVLVNDSQTLPGNEVITWRETAKKSLGTFRYLFRVLVVLELPAFFSAASDTRAPRSASDALIGFLYILWGVSVAFIAVQAVGLISSERSRQTLDVLLTAPLSGREIVLQKFRGVRRLIFVFLIPFLTIFFLNDFIRAVYSGENLLLSLLAVGIYLLVVDVDRLSDSVADASDRRHHLAVCHLGRISAGDAIRVRRRLCGQRPGSSPISVVAESGEHHSDHCPCGSASVRTPKIARTLLRPEFSRLWRPVVLFPAALSGPCRLSSGTGR